MNKKNEFQNVIDEIFEDDIYDICNKIPQGEVTKSLIRAASCFNKKQKTVSFVLGGYHFKISNRVGGFVSCSLNNFTAVSDTLYMPYPNDGEHTTKERFKNLLEMMNEAYYNCVN